MGDIQSSVRYFQLLHTYCFHILNVLPKHFLCHLYHRNNRGGVSGNMKSGCDSIVISRQDAQLGEQDFWKVFITHATNVKGADRFLKVILKNTLSVCFGLQTYLVHLLPFQFIL